MNNNPPIQLQRNRRSLAVCCLALAMAASAPAALVTYIADDLINTSSFAGGLGATNWDNGLPPAPGNDYLVPGGRTLRTPTNNSTPAAFTFAGDSLIMAGTLSMKGSNVLTVNNLILTNGSILNGDPSGTPKITRMAGNINVLTNGTLKASATNRTLVVTATLSGSGNLSVTDRGLVQLSGAHSFNGPLTITGTTLDMDGTVSITPSALLVGKDSIAGDGTSYNNATNIVRLGGSLNVGSGPGGDLRVGWRTTTVTTNIPLGVLDVSLQPSFTANVGNFTIGYSQASGAGVAGAAGIVLLATNNSITATNILIADTQEGTHQTRSLLTLGRGSNYLDTPIMWIGKRKQAATVTLPLGGTLLLTNSLAGRTDLTVGGNTAGTSINPSDIMDLSGGPFIASLGTLTIGLKSGGLTGGATGTLTTATNANNAIDVNDVVLGSMAGNASGSTTAASGTLHFNGGTLRINNSLTLGSLDVSGYGNATGTLNLNAGTINCAGDIYTGLGTGTLNVNAGLLDLLPAGDASPGNVSVSTLVLNGTITNAGYITVVGDLRGAGSIVSQTGVTTVSGILDPGTSTTPGTLKLGSLTLSSVATLRVNLTNNTTVGSGVNDLLDITGDVDLGGATLNIVQLGGGLAAGTYRLANYTGELIGTLNLPNVGRYSLSLATETGTSPKHLNLVVSGNPFALRWGGESGSAWDINTTQNWTNQANALDFYFDNDSVCFDDTSLNPYVTLDVTVQPGGTVFSNSVNSYTLTGTGKITGTAGLTKQGTGTLSVGTSNDFTGPVTISAGLFYANSGGALGATNGGTTIAAGATLDINDKNFSGEVIHVQGSGYDGNGAIINSDTLNANGARNATRFIALDGDTTFGGPSRWDIRGAAAANTGYLTGPNYTVTKVGPAGLYFTDGTVVNVSNIVVNEGSLVVESAATINPEPSITLSNGTTLGFYRLATPMPRPVTVSDGARIRSTDGTSTTQNEVSGPVTLGNGVAYVEATGNATNILHLSGKITGPGQLVKIGTQIVQLLNPSNDWSGGTTISSGTLSVGDGVVNGSLPAAPAVTNNARLMFNVAASTTVTPAVEITGPGALDKRGDGILALAVSNSFTGPVTTGSGLPLAGGVIRLLNPSGFGDPSISKTVSVIRSELQLSGGITLPGSVYLQTSAFTSLTGPGAGLAGIRNISGTNIVTGTIELIGGAGSSEYRSDADLLVLNGPVFLGNTSSRSAILSGSGAGVINGVLSDQGTNALTLDKRDAGTWTLTAANTFGGPTLVGAGTLLIDGSIGGSGVTVQTNGTLGGIGTINSAVTFHSGSHAVLSLGAPLTLAGALIVTNAGVIPDVHLNLSNNVPVGNYVLATYNVTGSSGSFSTNPVIDSGSLASGTAATIVTGGGTVTLQVVAAAPSTPPNFPAGGISKLPGGSISLTATGALGTPFRLWASTNVAASPITNTWTLLNSGTITSNPFTITDPDATNYSRRFYRFSTP